jgi:hypothetical protein
MRLNIFFLFLAAIFLSSCEDSMFLKSEKVLKNKIRKTWQMDAFGNQALIYFIGGDTVYYNEFWTFKDDKLYTIRELVNPGNFYDFGTVDSVQNDNKDTVDIATFSIDTKIFNAYLKLTLISGGTQYFVDKWEIIELDSDILDIAADDPGGSGVIQYEFYPRI